MPEIPSIPLSVVSFEQLRRSNNIYVDKTAQLYEIAKRHGSAWFMSRPRRFGKTLLISTFESLFRNGLKDFKGLAIEPLWNDGTYDVLKLDLSGGKGAFSDLRGFERWFAERLSDAVFACDPEFLFDERNPIRSFVRWLMRRPVDSVVVLVDEYDAPLMHNLGCPDLVEDIRDFYSRFFENLKSQGGKVRFTFITGVTRVQNTTIFSGFNSLVDITYAPEFADLLGYTTEEILDSYGPYIDEACRKTGYSREELIEGLRVNYDGYCFDRAISKHVHCPWSVMSYLMFPEKQFLNYWWQSGGQPDALRMYIAQSGLSLTLNNLESGVSVSEAELVSAVHYSKLPAHVILVQTGYLTFKSVNEFNIFTLGFPNREVRTSLALLMLDALLGEQGARLPPVKEGLLRGDVEGTVRTLNWYLGHIAHLRYPLRDEATVQGYVHTLFMGAGLDSQVEKVNSMGRSDLEVRVPGKCWIFEFKFARRTDNVDRLLEEAWSQMVEKRYGAPLAGETLVRTALVFSESERRFVRWKSEE